MLLDPALLREEGLSKWAEEVSPGHLDLKLGVGIDLAAGWEARAMARLGILPNISAGAEAFVLSGPRGFDAGALATLTAHF